MADAAFTLLLLTVVLLFWGDDLTDWYVKILKAKHETNQQPTKAPARRKR